MLNFGAIIIGDEILSGKRQDKHFARVIELLTQRGLELAWAEYLGDAPKRITATFQRTFATDDIVFSFGGIGATPDDHTRQCAAMAAGVNLFRHPDAVKEIEERFGEQAYPKRILMAEFPEGSEAIPNPFNRIPGFSLGRHYFLPGFPEMAWPMMEWVLDTIYPHLHHQAPWSEEIILIADIPESDVIDAMNAVLTQFDGVKVSSLPRFTPTGRELELAVKGKPEQVPKGMNLLKDAVKALGYSFVTKS
ncbi:MAG TPA: molybdopterin-binding protein [Burkholderiales bacterium]|nr:molybdopterin-binding protein [Burkholderiales bacterium]